MYRVFLFCAFLTYCSTAPYGGVDFQKTLPLRQEPLLGQQQWTNTHIQQDDSEVVDNIGAGYSFFRKQQIDSRPLTPSRTPAFDQDMSEYMKASAFKQQPLQSQILITKDRSFDDFSGQQQIFTRPNLPVQTLLPRTDQNTYGSIQALRPVIRQNDFSQVRPLISGGYGNQQFNTYGQTQQKDFQPSQNTYGQIVKPIQQQDLRTLWPPKQQSTYGQVQQQDLRPVLLPQQQILLPQTNLNFQQKTLSGYGNQQRDLSFIQQPKQTWSTEQKSTGFSSSYGGQGQKPVSSGFLIQSNQQNDMKPVTTALLMSSQLPTQRFISQSPPAQQTSFSSSSNGW
jgi:hypothetical protein